MLATLRTKDDNTKAQEEHMIAIIYCKMGSCAKECLVRAQGMERVRYKIRHNTVHVSWAQYVHNEGGANLKECQGMTGSREWAILSLCKRSR